MIDASWVIVDRATNRPVMETFNFELCQFVNIKKYRVMTILSWLVFVNQNIQEFYK